jgi:hypothetical protein
MARCYQCGAQTNSSQRNGSAICESCNGRLKPRETPLDLQQLNAAVDEARQNYRAEIENRRKTLEALRSKIDRLERLKVTQIADDKVELAAMRLREALRNFVVRLKERA